MKRIIISFAIAILAVFMGFTLYANLQHRFGWGVAGVTLDSPSNNLSVLSLSIFTYQDTYNRCPDSLRVLGPPAKGEATDWRAANLIEADLAMGKHSGYLYEYHRIGEGKWCEFTIHADPAASKPEKLHYYTDQTAVKRYQVGQRAGEGSPEYKKDN